VATAAPVVALRYADGALWAIDQTLLPWREIELELRCADDVVGAIRRLSIRGAPLIGVAAAYGVALELARDPDALEPACTALAAARPTAVNLAHAVSRVSAAVLAAGAAGGSGAAEVALAEARALHAEEEAASEAIARHGGQIWLQMDGGVSTETIERCADAGADVFVAGSAVYAAEDRDRAVRELRALAEKATSASDWACAH